MDSQVSGETWESIFVEGSARFIRNEGVADIVNAIKELAAL